MWRVCLWRVGGLLLASLVGCLLLANLVGWRSSAYILLLTRLGVNCARGSAGEVGGMKD